MPVGDSGGFFLSLVTESFAVRAFLGSLAAAVLAGVAVKHHVVRSRRARRLVVLAPVVTAAVAAVASFGEAYLPQIWITTASAGAAGQLVDLLGDLRVVATDSRVDLLAMAYGLVTSGLLARRLVGVLAVHRLLRDVSDPSGYGAVVALVQRLSSQVGVRTPRFALLARCPGGAFTAGLVRPVIVVDPELLHRLDGRELEGLLAHELAHVRRWDTLLSVVVGIFRDLTFFLPTVHVAARWLRREQEESADELASHHTGRPVALASSILKVWDASRERRSPSMACAAIPDARLATAGGVPTGPSEPVRALAARIERLIERSPAVTVGRRRVEVALAAVIMTSATTAALVVPSWIYSGYDTYSVSFGYLTPPASPSVESPAFATFRHLAPEPAALALGVPGRPGASLPVGVPERATPDRLAAMHESGAATARVERERGCPCVESQAQLRAGIAAEPAASPQMLWRDADHSAWEVHHLTPDRGVRPARPLWTLSDSGPQVGFFVFGSPSS